MHSDIIRILCIRKEQKGVADGQWHSAEMDSASSIATISVTVAVVTFLPWLALNWIYSQQLASEVLMCIFLIGKDVCQVRILNTPNKSFNLTIFIQNTRLKILQAGQILHNLFSKDFDHESVSFPVLALFKEKGFFFSIWREKALTNSLNYAYYIHERGTFVFTAAAWVSNTLKEGSYMPRVKPQRNQKSHTKFYS